MADTRTPFGFTGFKKPLTQGYFPAGAPFREAPADAVWPGNMPAVKPPVGLVERGRRAAAGLTFEQRQAALDAIRAASAAAVKPGVKPGVPSTAFDPSRVRYVPPTIPQHVTETPESGQVGPQRPLSAQEVADIARIRAAQAAAQAARDRAEAARRDMPPARGAVAPGGHGKELRRREDLEEAKRLAAWNAAEQARHLAEMRSSAVKPGVPSTAFDPSRVRYVPPTIPHPRPPGYVAPGEMVGAGAAEAARAAAGSAGPVGGFALSPVRVSVPVAPNMVEFRTGGSSVLPAPRVVEMKVVDSGGTSGYVPPAPVLNPPMPSGSFVLSPPVLSAEEAEEAKRLAAMTAAAQAQHLAEMKSRSGSLTYSH